ncbi:MAG: hypothetical protein KTR29_18750 [Rhodothermaceae bacterium]|nr:hypothetical protein [Rhodothermaceae bacterium]
MRQHTLPSVLVLLILFFAGCDTPAPVEHSSTEIDFREDPFILDLQERTFQWFWETTPDSTGLTPDRHPKRPFSSVAAVGFALTAYGVGAENGYVSRQEAAQRTKKTLAYFWNAPVGEQPEGVIGHHGFFYHFLHMDTGTRYRQTELSSIDTALFMAGALFAQSYFDGDDPVERDIRAYADSLYRRVEWTWFQRDKAPLITMGHRPERGGFGQAAYQGYNEAMILYILALGAPTHSIDADAWSAYTSTYQWGEFFGQEMVQFSPLFGHQYSHVWIDFRGIFDEYMREKGIDYFENSRRATLSQQAFAMNNPNGFKEYGEFMWGLTASDGPAGEWHIHNGDSVRFRRYWARGASLRHVNDDGTIAPTAAGGSLPFAPDIVVPTLKNFHDRYEDHVFNEYGFVDAFNPSFTFEGADIEFGHVDPELGWFDSEQLGIDQGPIVLMIENYRSELVWDVMKTNPYIVQGLCKAGFRGGWLESPCTTENASG